MHHWENPEKSPATRLCYIICSTMHLYLKTSLLVVLLYKIRTVGFIIAILMLITSLAPISDKKMATWLLLYGAFTF